MSAYVLLTPTIIASMQQLAVEQRRRLGDRAPWHSGDIAWGFRQHEGREHEWRIRVWEEDGAVVAWSWLKAATGTLDLDVRADRRELLDEILDEPDASTVFAFDDDTELLAAFSRHGFTQPKDPMQCLARDLPAAPELPTLTDGLRYRTVGPDDLAERVAIHRDVWAPSRVTESSYAGVQATPPYRLALDCIVESPDGRFAAYALLWPEDTTGVGELEPVGVREEFRRRGLGAAVCTFALRRWHEEGGRRAIVYCVTPPACALYESIGFRVQGTIVGYAG